MMLIFSDKNSANLNMTPDENISPALRVTSIPSVMIEREFRMTDKDFIERGYREFPPPLIVSENVTRCFQKRFDDAVGKKYFITVYKWEWPDRYSVANGYEYAVQLYRKRTHEAVDLTFHSQWDVADVEDYIELLFDTGLFDHYEEF